MAETFQLTKMSVRDPLEDLSIAIGLIASLEEGVKLGCFDEDAMLALIQSCDRRVRRAHRSMARMYCEKIGKETPAAHIEMKENIEATYDRMEADTHAEDECPTGANERR